MSVLNILEEKLAETKKQGRFREFLNLERGVQDKPWATSHGHHGERRLNVWCSNDYLAMSHHPKVLLATTEAVNRVGLGTCGARSISGTSVYHSELETLLASAYGKESALLFTTGFGANDATLSTLCDAIPDLIVFSDELNHASMIYGIRYSKAEKKIFRHNDVAHLAELLQAADPARPKLIAFESLYSMDGDFAPLAQIVALAEQYQALNPFWIMLASPILAALYNKMGDRLPMPHKFAFGMILCSCAFLVLPWGASFANEQGIVSVNWLILSYALQSIGELMISGLGLAMVAQLVPQRLMGFIMGSWFLTTAAAALIAGKVAGLTAVPSDINDAHASLAIYSHVFMQIGIVTAVIAILMMLTAPKLYRMTLDTTEDANQKAQEATAAR